MSCTALLQGPALASNIPLEPTKPWDLDYGATQCTAMREYNSADGPITLAIIPAPNDENYELVVTYKRHPPVFAEEYAGSVIFASRPISGWALKYGVGNLTLYQFRVTSSAMDQALNAPTLTLRANGEIDLSFALDNMKALVDGLRKCTADLRDYWNFDGEKNGRIAVSSKGDIRSDFSASDYPREALRRMQDGSAQYLLLIDERGYVMGCHVLKPSGVPALDAMGCLVIQERSKLTPAKDPNGKPVRSALETPPVVWRIER
ncbi:MAG TPA: energy transducer TonB [Sphingomicrobium sp.]|nr:energy transducer TonB [Sphingomicrobium sp.]